MSFQDPEEVASFYRDMLSGVADEHDTLTMLLRQGEDLRALACCFASPASSITMTACANGLLAGVGQIVGDRCRVLESFPLQSLHG